MLAANIKKFSKKLHNCLTKPTKKRKTAKSAEKKETFSLVQNDNVLNLIDHNDDLSNKILKIKHAQQAVKLLSRENRWRDVLIFCRWFLETHGEFPKIYSYLGKAELFEGSAEHAYKFLYKAIETDNTKNNNLMLFQALKIAGKWDQAVEAIQKTNRKFKQPENEPIETSFDRLIGSAKFLSRANELFHSVEQPQEIKGVVFLSSFLCENTIGLNLLALNTLKKRGYAVIHLCEGILNKQLTGDKDLDQFQNIIGYKKNFIRGERPKNERYFDWKVDWDNKIVQAENINFYQCFFERLSRDFHKYTIAYDEQTAQYLNNLIDQADASLKVIKDIERKFAHKKNFPVRFLSGSSQYVPYGIFRTYCANQSHQFNFEFISTLIGKEFNFYNKINDFSNYVSTRNVTAYSNTRMPQLPPRDGFLKWVKNNPISEKDLEFIERFISYDRNMTSEIHPEGQKILNRIAEERAVGRPIVTVFGKVIWDFDYPYDKGPAHNGLKDWINHTIETAAKSDALFLIKPHPHEEMEQIAGKPNERFVDLINVDIPDNVIILGKNWLNTKDLFDKIDLGVVWAGTVQLDLGINNIPVLTCCDWGAKDYPVDFMRPNNREHYEFLLSNVYEVKAPKNSRNSCINVLRYMASDELFIPYRYYVRSTTNLLLIPEWIEDDLDQYMSHGDIYVEKQADRFFQDRPSFKES